MRRRDFITALSGAAAWPLVAHAQQPAEPPAARAVLREDRWRSGPIDHILPTVNSRRLLLKVSFDRPLGAVALVIGGRRVAGQRTDTEGKFWEFDARDLQPSRTYSLALIDAAARPLGDPWPLRTFPDPQNKPDKLRLAIYTCAGGKTRHAVPRRILLSVIGELSRQRRPCSIKAPPRPPTLPIDGADGASYSVPMHQALIPKRLKSKHPNHYNRHEHESGNYFSLSK